MARLHFLIAFGAGEHSSAVFSRKTQTRLDGLEETPRDLSPPLDGLEVFVLKAKERARTSSQVPLDLCLRAWRPISGLMGRVDRKPCSSFESALWPVWLLERRRQGSCVMDEQQRFQGSFTQDRVDQLVQHAYRLETILNIAAPDSSAARTAACLVTELRTELCQRGGAADPFPDMPMFPHFEETRIFVSPKSLWADHAAASERQEVQA
jgi:hypothetical protein